jgi:hypothetical protein
MVNARGGTAATAVAWVLVRWDNCMPGEVLDVVIGYELD